MYVCKCAIYTSSQTVRLGIPFIFHAIRIFYGWIPSCEGGHGQHIQHLDPSPVAPLSSKVLLPRGSTCRWCSSPGVRVRTQKKKTCIKTHYCSGIILTNYYTISIIVLHNIVRVKNTVFNPRDDWNKQELHSNGPRCKVYFGGSCIFYIFWTNGSNSHIFNHIYPLVN
jgi:hypothetical protein